MGLFKVSRALIFISPPAHNSHKLDYVLSFRKLSTRSNSRITYQKKVKRPNNKHGMMDMKRSAQCNHNETYFFSLMQRNGKVEAQKTTQNSKLKSEKSKSSSSSKEKQSSEEKKRLNEGNLQTNDLNDIYIQRAESIFKFVQLLGNLARSEGAFMSIFLLFFVQVKLASKCKASVANANVNEKFFLTKKDDEKMWKQLSNLFNHSSVSQTTR